MKGGIAENERGRKFVLLWEKTAMRTLPSLVYRTSLTQLRFALAAFMPLHCRSHRRCGHSTWLSDAKSKPSFRCAAANHSTRGQNCGPSLLDQWPLSAQNESGLGSRFTPPAQQDRRNAGICCKCSLTLQQGKGAIPGDKQCWNWCLCYPISAQSMGLPYPVTDTPVIDREVVGAKKGG